MMSMLGILEGFLANLLFLLVMAFLGWLWLVLTRRHRLLSFFGLEHQRRLMIYLSNLTVQPGGAIGADGQKRSYEGAAVSFGEMSVANRFREFFNYLFPSLSDRPGILSRILIADVQVQITPSPPSQGQLDKTFSCVAMGSPAYNAASQFAEKELHSKARFSLGEASSDTFVSDLNQAEKKSPEWSASHIGFVNENEWPLTSTGSPIGMSRVAAKNPSPFRFSNQPRQPSVPILPSSIMEMPAILVKGIPPITDGTCGFVERIVLAEEHRSFFYVAGISELATVGAANYLLSEWKQLHDKYGSQKSFLIMLRFEPGNYRHSSVLFEL